MLEKFDSEVGASVNAEHAGGLRVVVINDASSARGGATGLTIELMKGLRARGVPVTFVCGDGGDAVDLLELGIEMSPVGGAHLLQQSKVSALGTGLYNRAAKRHLANWIAANDTPNTVYHLHGWSKILSPSVFAALKPVEHRLIVHAHDFFLACPNGGYANFQTHTPCDLKPMSPACLATHCDKRSYPQKLWRVGRHALRRSLFDLKKSPARIAAIHEDMIEGLVLGGVPAASICALRNPVHPFRQNRIRAEENRKVVFVGRLFEEKGADLAAAACREAGVSMMVIGEGDDGARIREANPDVAFMGWRSREEIGELASEARLLVMPSRYPEPFGLVALEALMSGLPVVLSSSALLSREIVARGMGAGVNPFDQAEFSATLARLDADSEAVQAMSETAFAHAGELCLTPDAWVTETLALYRDQLRASRERGHA